MVNKRARVRLLNETTINQIAAGEVVEGSASVVKELVENALDAKAQEILIETHGGGRGLIRVSDNGWGMSKDDLLLALERHATSKISEFEDLTSINTLGFRGEALPAIASISKMLLSSSPDDTGEGTSVYVVGGKIKELRKISRMRGTTFEVRSLFFNVPVRKKFQKTIAADTARIHKVLSEMALSHLPVTFSWINGGERQFFLPGKEPWLDRINSLVGQEFAANSLLVEQYEKPLSLNGYTSHPSHHRLNKTGQHLYINGRAVFSLFVSKCVLEGYGTRLPTNRHPLFVLSLTLPTAWVDVNVHPQKREIRLKEEKRIALFVTEAIDKSLQRRGTSYPTRFEEVFEQTYELSEPLLRLENPEPENRLVADLSVRIIGKIDSYLLVEDAKGISVIDVHRARARILFEQMVAKQEDMAIQNLLIPINLEYSGAEKAQLLTSLEMLNELGISIRHFGGDSFLVDAIPSFFEIDEISNIIHAVFEEGKQVDKKGAMLRFCRTLKGSIRSFEEGKALVERLYQCEVPDESPEGMPTALLLTKKELARQFRKHYE